MSYLSILMPPAVKQQLDAYIDAADGEISGLGRVKMNGSVLTVEEIFLFKQVCSSASTVLSDDDVANFLIEAVDRGIDPSELKLWWHSHAKMNVFWSKTDDDNIETFANGWMLSIVGNKAGNYLCRVDLYEPLRLTLDKLPLQIILPYDPEIDQKAADEVAEKVKHIRYIQPVHTGWVNPNRPAQSKLPSQQNPNQAGWRDWRSDDYPPDEEFMDAWG